MVLCSREKHIYILCQKKSFHHGIKSTIFYRCPRPNLKPMRLLFYVVLILMTTQSVGAMADVHSLHQTGTEHLNFSDGHEHLEPIEQHLGDLESAEHSEQSWDCHHCCHCHGHSCFAVVMSATDYIPPLDSSSAALNKDSIKLEAYRRIFRPPIA